MGIMEGGTIKDFAQMEVDICFTFEPIGTKKTIEQILMERNPKSPYLKKMMQEETDKMVSRRYLYYDKNKKVYVFSKDSESKYSWQPATVKDRIMNYLLNVFS